MRYLRVCFLSFIIFFCSVCSLQAGEKMSVAVVQTGEASPLQKSLKGYLDFFQERAVEIDLSRHMLKADLSNAGNIVSRIRTRKPQIVLSLGSLPLKTVCPELEKEFIIIGVSLRQVDFNCAQKVGGVYLEYPPEIQLEWMRRILPRAKNIGVIYSTPQNKKNIADASIWARQMGVTILKREVSAPYQIPAALSDLANRADVLWGISDSIVLNPGTVRKMLLFSFRNKVPFIGLSKAWGKAGALYALDRDYADIGRQCAEMAHEAVEENAKHTLSPQPPRQIRYYLNLKTAQHFKIDLSASLIQGAEESY